MQICFNTDIDKYHDELVSFGYEKPDEFNTEYYKSQDDNLMIAVRKNILEGIFAYQELYYQNINLMDLTLSEFKQLLQTDYVAMLNNMI